MNYILLDLEWNSAYSKRCGKFVNEIIQIGAVKLDSHLNYVDDFSEMVHSQLTNKLSNRFKTLTNITNDDMLSGVSLSEAIDLYNEWAGTDILTLTWSTSDLYAILENCQMFASGNEFYFERYADLQGFVQDYLHRNGKKFDGQISLKTAAEMLELRCDDLSLHTARDDSLLSAKLLLVTFDEKRLVAVTKDATLPEFYDRLTFKPYNITSINDKNIDKCCLRFKCDQCGNYAHRKTKWVYKNRWFRAGFKCRSCGNKFTGQLSFKKNYDGVLIKRVVIPFKKTEDVHEPVQSVSAEM